MLSAKDKKYLSGMPDRLYLISVVTLITVTLIFSAAFIHNLYLAKIIGSVEGYGLEDVANLCANGVELKENYSGIYLMDVNRFEMAFLDLGVVVILVMSLWASRASRRRNMRIVQALKKGGVW